MKKLEAFTVSLPSNAQRKAIADRSKARRIAMDRQEYINKMYAGTDRQDGSKTERLAMCRRAADRVTFTGEYRIH